MEANRPNGDCVLLVFPDGNYGEVISKRGEMLEVQMQGCGTILPTTVAEFEKLGAKPVKTARIMKADGTQVYMVGVEGGTGEFYTEGQYYPSVAITPDHRQWR